MSEDVFPSLKLGDIPIFQPAMLGTTRGYMFHVIVIQEPSRLVPTQNHPNLWGSARRVGQLGDPCVFRGGRWEKGCISNMRFPAIFG